MNDISSLGIDKRYGVLIGHDERPGRNATMPVYDPSTGAQISEVPVGTTEDVNDAV